MGDTYAGFQEIDYFIDHPATPEEIDYLALERQWGIHWPGKTILMRQQAARPGIDPFRRRAKIR